MSTFNKRSFCLVALSVLSLLLAAGRTSQLNAQDLGDSFAEAAGSATATDEKLEIVEGDIAGAEWIWSPSHDRENVPVSDCYFRKTFTIANLGTMEFAEIQIAADNEYQLFVNGKEAGKGNDWRAMDVIDVRKLLVQGNNTLAVRVNNLDSGSAGLVARVLIQDKSGKTTHHSTDKTWKTSIKAGKNNWQALNYSDKDWLSAESYGALGDALPWGNEVVLRPLGIQFAITDEDIVVETILSDSRTSSLIAMAFDHAGDIILSQEGGPLLRAADTDKDGDHDKISVCCEKLKNVQGILPMGNQLLAVGTGPQGGALYSCKDTNRDGVFDEVKVVLSFRGSTGEHGPHSVQLGRDGYIYVLVGNHAQVNSKLSPQSPYKNFYEGDIVHPRYQDPQGHAVGVSAPGGTIFRTDRKGSFVEVVAGGFRNPYDFGMLPDGEIITYDADMEWDMGAPWYRPTRINHVTKGAEFGWRSGWAKWPEYYVDSLPSIMDIGPGSPTGVVVYDHNALPKKYHGALFVGDWARGRIDVINLQPDGSSYHATFTKLLQGAPLNVTDLAVSPKGWVYFCTGGRGTAGGIYRLRTKKGPLPESQNLGNGIDRALLQQQLDAPWAQAAIAGVRRQLGKKWGPQLQTIAFEGRGYSAKHRARALDLMHLYGPQPSVEMLLGLTKDKEVLVKAKAINQLGTKGKSPQKAAIAKRLAELLTDEDARIRRLACESSVRGGFLLPSKNVIELFKDEDRFVRFAARRALEIIPVEQWQQTVMEAPKSCVFLNGAVALMAVSPNEATGAAIMNRCVNMMRGEINDPDFAKGFLSDHDFIDLLRIQQIAMARCGIKRAPQQVGRALTLGEKAMNDLAAELVQEYPTKGAVVNREIVKLMVAMQVPEAAAMFAKQLSDEKVPFIERMHVAAYASRLKVGWDRTTKIKMIQFLDAARSYEGGYSVGAYVEQFTRAFLEVLTPAEKNQILAAATDWPLTALSMLISLPKDVDLETLKKLATLDQSIQNLKTDEIARLRVGITAILGRSGNPNAHAYLRQVYQTVPGRREVIAMSLTQNPDGENWAFLIDSLKIAEGPVASEILVALTKVRQAPQTPEAYRNLILLGLKSKPSVAGHVNRLLQQWTGQAAIGNSNDMPTAMKNWQAWYSKQFANAPVAELPKASAENKWSYGELLSYLDSEKGSKGNASRGAMVFQSAQCIACHRFGSQGERIGPDLSTVASRFHTKEILESIVYPSHNISDQYASKVVVANGLRIVGLVAPDGQDAVVVLQENGQKKRVLRSDVEKVEASNLSAMPEGLMNKLTLEQLADLFAFLRSQPQTATAPAANPAARK